MPLQEPAGIPSSTPRPERKPEAWLRALLIVVVAGIAAFVIRGVVRRPAADPWQKVELDLHGIANDGLRGPADGKVAVSYEFSIPNTDECKARVRAIDATVQFMPGSQGRVRAPKDGCLCIGSTHQPDYRDVLRRLAELPYVERIIECHFE
jgi:hypothetical protein